MANAVVVHWKEHHSSVFTRIYENFLEEKFTDVIVRCGDLSKPAHSVILAGNSSYLEATIAKDSGEIIFPAMTKNMLEKFFEFLYLGATILEERELDSFLTAGRLLEINGLTEIDPKFDADDSRYIINSKEDFRSLLQKVDAAAESTSDTVLDQAQVAIRKVAQGSHLAIERIRRCLQAEREADEEENALTEDNVAALMISEEIKKENWAINQQEANVDAYKSNLQENLHLLMLDDDNNQYWVEDDQNAECYLLKSNDMNSRLLSDTAREIGSDESTQEASEVDCPPSDSENDAFLN